MPDAVLRPRTNDLLGNPDCPDCFGIGYIRNGSLNVGDPGFGKIYPCTCWEGERIKTVAMKAAAELAEIDVMTDTERQVSFDDVITEGRPGTKDVLIAMMGFANKPKGFVTVWGRSGNAKTTCMFATVNQLRSRGILAVYVTAFDLVSYIREAFSEDRRDGHRTVKSASAYERIQKLENIEVLVIDEMDKINSTAWVWEQITELVDKRYRFALDKRSGTVFCMNSDPKSLNQPHLYSRLTYGLSAGGFKMIVNNDGDLRQGIQDNLFEDAE